MDTSRMISKAKIKVSDIYGRINLTLCGTKSKVLQSAVLAGRDSAERFNDDVMTLGIDSIGIKILRNAQNSVDERMKVRP